MTQKMQDAAAARGGYKVDVSRGSRVGRVSTEWFNRPDDERFLSLSTLYASVRARTERSRTRTVESAAIRVEAGSSNAESLSLVLPGADRSVAPTHWSFSQLASLVGAPANYLRQLPPQLAGINLQYGLSTHRAEQVKTLELEDGRVELGEFREVMDEARHFLLLPNMLAPTEGRPALDPAPTGSTDAARRLLRFCRPIAGTIAERYLSHRGINDLHETDALRFHPRCYYRSADGSIRSMPAMVAAVTDLGGRVTGAHRTWLADDGNGKAAVTTPRRAMGQLAGHAVRFGAAADVLAAGEGIETMLSLRQILPALPMAAALSAAHLGALALPKALRRLYIVRDDDGAGDEASNRLATRALEVGIHPILLSPTLADFNDDLQLIGLNAMRASIRLQLAVDDVDRFVRP